MMFLVRTTDWPVAVVLEVFLLVNKSNRYDDPWIVKKVPLCRITPPPISCMSTNNVHFSKGKGIHSRKEVVGITSARIDRTQQCVNGPSRRRRSVCVIPVLQVLLFVSVLFVETLHLRKLIVALQI